MSCRICHSASCASWMHSVQEQELFEEREKMSDNVDTLRREIQELQGDILFFKSESAQCLSKNQRINNLLDTLRLAVVEYRAARDEYDANRRLEFIGSTDEMQLLLDVYKKMREVTRVALSIVDATN